jgi:hypothetical protein
MTLAGNISTVSLESIVLSTTPLTIEQVANRMKPWLERSAFHRIFKYELPYPENEEQAAATPPEVGDLEHRFDMVKQLLADGVNSVNGLSFCFQGDRDLSAVLRQLRDVMRLVHERLGSDISTEDQYRLVYPFTAWFVKSPAASFVSLSKKNPYMLVFLLHMYAVVVTLTLALPRIDVPLFAKYRLRAILQICNVLKDDPGFLCQRCNGFHAYKEIMSFPMNSVSAYQLLGREKGFPGA